jgi:diacylglycerol kinase
MTKILKSFLYAWNGLKTAWREEFNFRIEVIAAIVVIFCITYFSFSYIETAFCILAIMLVLGAEITNTIVEDLCNKIQPSQDPTIGKIKDMMAAFVLLCVLGAAALGLIIFIHHFS